MANVVTQNQREGQESPGLQVELLELSFGELAPRGAEFVASLYQRLFSMYPETELLFADMDMKEQENKLLNALVLVVDNLRKPDVLGPALKKLGQRHKELNIRQDHYPMFGAALLGTFEEFFGSKWTPELKLAWIEAYGAVVADMQA